MVQLLAMPEWGDRLIFASFEADQVGMLDISNPYVFVQQSVVISASAPARMTST
jgi:hypothetical protein